MTGVARGRRRAAAALGLLVLLCGWLAAGIGPAAAQAAAGSQLSVSVRASDLPAPVVVLTNEGLAPCLVATTSLGTVVLTRVEQAGAAVERFLTTFQRDTVADQ